MAKRVDVAIVGSGSAGLCAALWLSRYNIRCKIFEKRDGPLKLGHADGVQCRTVEIFESFDIHSQLLDESHPIVEVMFWAAEDTKSGIRRQGRTADPPPGLSHQPHVVLKQARVNELMIEEMGKKGQGVDYDSNVVDVIYHKNRDEYPITCIVEQNGVQETFEAKYLLGCDGAHSTTRHALDIKMEGDSTDAIWGVMDVTVQTDFPDIRKKSTIRTPEGSVLIIPREDPGLIRFYVELPHGTNSKEVRLETIHEMVRRIMRPYSFDFRGCLSWSAYSIGQRVASSLHQDYRIFLTGDACHTHSPKAGQGMNVSLQDGYNIGWKLGMVLSGRANPSLLKTYVTEREKIAEDLIDFDRRFARIFASDVDQPATPEEFEDAFVKSGKFTTGLAATYEESAITAKSSKSHSKTIENGMRFPTSQVVRYCDSIPTQLLKVLQSDGRWRIVVFGGQLENLDRVNKIGHFFLSAKSPLMAYKSKHDSIDSLIEILLVMKGDRSKIEFKDFHRAFWPETGDLNLNDLNKIYFDDESYHHGHGHAYDAYGIDAKSGCIVVVRPDQCKSSFHSTRTLSN
ncbi:uncharacterized protein N7477_002346 [Penicillium maclennaniae]|uniref:uncharacterized protein n=1 Tax=Penicillium maclennaniae TaxID=1343394 RepID=UPI002541E60E|nr:uncharacterized protein N7477_002346 [Penicillium maclennaniae]KAJ5676713.1 hypothetical protein N7477_002346 [Penicillium maclennaniae]